MNKNGQEGVGGKIYLLDESDRATTAWRKIRKYLLIELLRLRERNDAKLSYEDTCILRGHIARIKIILEAADGEIRWRDLEASVDEGSIEF